MTSKIAVLGIVLASVTTFALTAANAGDRTVKSSAKPVLELYTSQGCSSCPPADKLLGRYASRGDVVALTLPVDYWDYLGWKDTLANPIYSNRQRSYARARGDGQVYTPQIVIDGLKHAVGSVQSSVERAIRVSQKKIAANRVSLSMTAKDDALIIQTGAAPEGAKVRKGTIWLALVTKKVTVKIKRGENRGRKISYYNVVRELTPVGKWEGDAMSLKLPKNHLMKRGADGCTVLLQAENSGPILAAAEIKDW